MPFQPYEPRDPPLAPLNDSFKFFIANMDFNTTVQDVKSFFSAFGAVNFVKIISDARTKRSRGFGFLYMLDATGDAAVASFAAEHNHRITLMGKVRVFLARHDNNREQPRMDGKQSHDGNLAKIQGSHYAPSNTYSNNVNAYQGAYNPATQSNLPYGPAATTATPQGAYGSAVHNPASSNSYGAIQNPALDPSLYAAQPNGTATAYLPSYSQQQYSYQPDPGQAAVPAPYSQPQTYGAAPDYSTQAAAGYSAAQIPPQTSQPVLYSGEATTSYGGQQPVQSNTAAQYSQTNALPPQQTTAYPPYSSVSENAYTTGAAERDPSYSQYSKNPVVYDSQQQQQSGSTLLPHSSIPPQNQPASQPAKDPASTLSTKVLIQNLPRHTPPKDVVSMLSQNKLTVVRCTMEFPTENPSQAYAHVNLGSPGDAAACLLLSQQQKLLIEGHILTASLDQSPPSDGIPVGRGAPASTGPPRTGRGRGRGRGAGRFDRKQRFDRPY